MTSPDMTKPPAEAEGDMNTQASTFTSRKSTTMDTNNSTNDSVDLRETVRRLIVGLGESGQLPSDFGRYLLAGLVEPEATDEDAPAGDTRTLDDYEPTRSGRARRKVSVAELRELGMWFDPAPVRDEPFDERHPGELHYHDFPVFLAGASVSPVGRVRHYYGQSPRAEVQEWAIEAALKLDVETNVKLAADALAAYQITRATLTTDTEGEK